MTKNIVMYNITKRPNITGPNCNIPCSPPYENLILRSDRSSVLAQIICKHWNRVFICVFTSL